MPSEYTGKPKDVRYKENANIDVVCLQLAAHTRLLILFACIRVYLRFLFLLELFYVFAWSAPVCGLRGGLQCDKIKLVDFCRYTTEILQIDKLI